MVLIKHGRISVRQSMVREETGGKEKMEIKWGNKEIRELILQKMETSDRTGQRI